MGAAIRVDHRTVPRCCTATLHECHASKGVKLSSVTPPALRQAICRDCHQDIIKSCHTCVTVAFSQGHSRSVPELLRGILIKSNLWGCAPEGEAETGAGAAPQEAAGTAAAEAVSWDPPAPVCPASFRSSMHLQI